MKWVIASLLFFSWIPGRAQSGEDFVNTIAKLVVDSNFSQYYLFSDATPCSFKKFDYDEWYKYGLKEDVPIYILNELAKKSFDDAAPRYWQQQKLLNAFCIGEENAKALLSSPQKKHRKANRVVYYFSRPEFTDDYQYAVIDLGFRCDDRQCGMGATFLFKQVNGKWTVAGKKMAWGN